MPTSATNLFDYAILSDATYADFLSPPPGGLPDYSQENVARVLQLISGRGFSESQATDFSATWEVLSQQPNTASGFSATLFRNRLTGETVFAIVGTEAAEQSGVDLIVADGVQLVGSGLAYAQMVDMYNYWLRLNAPAGATVLQATINTITEAEALLADPSRLIRLPDTVIPDDLPSQVQVHRNYLRIDFFTSVVGLGLGLAEYTGLLAVTGHSLGGHLAAGFSRIFGTPAITINGAGYPTGFFPGLSGFALQNIQNVFATLTGDSASAFIPENIFNIYGDRNPEVVTQNWALVQPGSSHNAIYIEDASAKDATLGHGASGMTDSMAVYDLFFRLDSNLSSMDGAAALAALKPIFDAASNNDKWEGNLVISKLPNRSLENIVIALSGIFGFPSQIPTDNRQSLYSHIHYLLNSDWFIKNQGTFHVTSLVGMSSSDMVSAARNDIGVLYALVNLNPFALTGNTAFYNSLNVNGTYDLDKFSNEFLADRAEMLRIKILYDTGIPDSNGANLSRDRFYAERFATSAPGNFDYVSLGANGEDFRLEVDGYNAGNTQVIMFGDGTLNELTGGAGDDRLYGLGGDDRLVGGAGNDRLEGGEGLDQYVVGEGVDTLLDSDGDGRIVWSSVDDFVVRGRDGVGNPTKDWIKISDTQYFDRQNTVTYTLLMQADGSTTLSIVSPTRTTGTARLRIENFHDGDLGITLGEAVAAPIVDTITDGPDVYGVNSVTLGLAHAVNGLGGNDLISGGVANDYLVGGDGNDLLIGNVGADTYIGGDGDDFIMDNGYDSANATPMPLTPALEAQTVVVLGQDWYITQQGDGYKFAYDSLPDNVSYGSPEAESDVVLAGQGNDHVWLGVGNDFADGGEGDDYIEGGQDHDTVSGGAGNDVIWGDDPDAYGNEQFISNGNDVLSGDAGEDSIVGNGGNDTINGGADNDLLFGDNTSTVNELVSLEEQVTGEDVIDAGDGDDSVQGGGGDDLILGGAGNDWLAGDNAINGQMALYRSFDGKDEIHGGEGNDTIAGMGGDDVIYGDAGDDIILGDNATMAAEQEGNDTIYGGAGHDRIGGNGGDDTLDGGSGDDELSGNEGNDTLEGGLGNDSLQGGAGNDIYLINGAWGRDAIFGLDAGDAGQDIIRFGAGISPDSIHVALTTDGLFLYRDADNVVKLDGFMGGNHRIEFADGTVWTSQEVMEDLLQQLREAGGEADHLVLGGESSNQLIGTVGADLGYGFAGDDVMTVGAGHDYVNGGEGNDSINGEAGNDVVLGGLGSDSLNGGDDNDQLFGELGNDTLSGGNGSDYLSGGEGEDVLNGGQGNDIMDGGAGSDTYEFSVGFGQDTVINLGVAEGLNDSIVFAEGIVASSLIYLQGDNGSLIIQVKGTSDTLRLEGFFAVGANHSIRFASGAVVQQNAIASLLQIENTQSVVKVINGTNGVDLISGGAGNDKLYGEMGNDTLIGNGGDDLIYGGPLQQNSILSDMTDDDSIFGGAGNDALYGSKAMTESTAGPVTIPCGVASARITSSVAMAMIL